MKYFVICTNEDGETSVFVMGKDELEKALAEKYWGSIPIHELSSTVCLGDDSGIWIIKGESVLPRAEEVVTRLSVP